MSGKPKVFNSLAGFVSSISVDEASLIRLIDRGLARGVLSFAYVENAVRYTWNGSVKGEALKHIQEIAAREVGQLDVLKEALHKVVDPELKGMNNICELSKILRASFQRVSDALGGEKVILELGLVNNYFFTQNNSQITDKGPMFAKPRNESGFVSREDIMKEIDQIITGSDFYKQLCTGFKKAVEWPDFFNVTTFAGTYNSFKRICYQPQALFQMAVRLYFENPLTLACIDGRNLFDQYVRYLLNNLIGVEISTESNCDVKSPGIYTYIKALHKEAPILRIELYTPQRLRDIARAIHHARPNSPVLGIKTSRNRLQQLIEGIENGDIKINLEKGAIKLRRGEESYRLTA